MILESRGTCPHCGQQQILNHAEFLTQEQLDRMAEESCTCEAGQEIRIEMLEGLHDHCLMCSMDPAQQRACPLRKALDELPSDIPDRQDGGCRFHGIV